jgi:hypothetical protein
MADLKSVQYSQMGEAVLPGAKRAGKDISGLVKFDAKNPPDPEKEKEWIVFKLVTNTNQGGVYLSSVDDVVNPKTGKVERIRLLNGVDTIWLKEQKDITKEYADKNLREIAFPRGVKLRRVKKIDNTLIEFLRICNANVGNVNRIGSSRFEIYEYDFAAAEKDAFEFESFQFEMETIARTAKLDQMRKHAAFLGIRLVNNETGEPKTEDGIRREYARYAKQNPNYFKQTLNTDQIEVSWLVRKAIGDSLIDIGREPGKIFWAKGGGMIGVYPQTENAQDYLTNLALTNNEEGRRFKEQLKQVVT